MMKTGKYAIALASACALTLGACSYDPEDDSAVDGEESAEIEQGNETVAELVAGAGELDGVKDLLNDAGMADMFDGNAPYTVFAPTDDALDALGEDFEGEEADAALLAVLREHIVPGYLTSEDIAAAIDANDGSVEMQTMGDAVLTFTRKGDNVSVATPGGISVMLADEMRGANGVVYAVDTVLKDVEPTD